MQIYFVTYNISVNWVYPHIGILAAIHSLIILCYNIDKLVLNRKNYAGGENARRPNQRAEDRFCLIADFWYLGGCFRHFADSQHDVRAVRFKKYHAIYRQR